ncbi:MAG TPA: type IV pilus secretin PilQ [Candidatus Eisenbacteria bacterium]
MRTGKVLTGLILIAGSGLAALVSAPVAAQESSAMQQVGLVKTGEGTFSIDVAGADVHTVMRAISQFAGKNIVVDGDVKGEVTISLKNVGWESALRTILRSRGLDYVEEGGIIRVDEASKLQAEATDREAARSRQMELIPLETRILKLNYANASELIGPLQASLSRRGLIQAEKRTNTLIVTDLPTIVDRVEKMATELDSSTPQIEITAKLVDVDKQFSRDLGITWGVTGLSPNNNPANGTANVNVTEPKTPSSATIDYAITKNWGSVSAKIDMLERMNKANIISNPRITTVDNREAKILVGQKIPLIVQDVAGNPVSQLQTIGIQLKVTPHLTQDKKIIMDLHPEVSDLATQSTVQGGVIINTSEADTRVMVDDGQTAVIGGLIRTNDGVIRQGVPILKDFPIIGILFRSSNTSRQNRELIIFVTPRLLTDMASR